MENGNINNPSVSYSADTSPCTGEAGLREGARERDEYLRAKPILFNAEMVCAILDGRKTQTRRILKVGKGESIERMLSSPYHKEHPEVSDCELLETLCFPAFNVGDIVYVREAWNFVPCIECVHVSPDKCGGVPLDYEDREMISEGCYIYRADCAEPERKPRRDGFTTLFDGKDAASSALSDLPYASKPASSAPELTHSFLGEKCEAVLAEQIISEPSLGREGHIGILPSGTVEEQREFVRQNRRVFDSSRLIWRPSIHMPKKAARLFLHITGVHVERLQDITLQDIYAEGVVPSCKPLWEDGGESDNHSTNLTVGMCAEKITELKQMTWEFMNIWEETVPEDKRSQYGWDADPFVWVYEFEVI